jgi:hypothetical protein
MTVKEAELGLTSRASEGSAVRRILTEHGLSIALAALFILAAGAQIASGLHAYNEDRLNEGRPAVELWTYLGSGHFLEALFENWESEFLQMGVFVLLSVRLRQKGSAESKPFDGPNESDEDPRKHRNDPDAPWPVRRGGVILKLYENSLAIAFFLLFVASFLLHAVGGRIMNNEERALHGLPPEGLLEFLSSSQFWYESFQNWQSEFLAILSIVVFTIFLRQRGSPQSKPVAAPHAETGG